MSAKGVLAALAPLAAGSAMLAWTSGTWPDVLVDFGGELYVPWRLSEGDVLYRDVAYFTGPLSPYWNALLFALFGASLRTLVVANLAVLAGVAVLLFRLLDRSAGRLPASAGLCLFFALFAFGQLEVYGNSNFVCPYSHETTHGALIALAALSALLRWVDSRRAAPLALAGLLLGLAFLTKVEVFLATGAALGLGFALARARLREWGTLAACALAPPAAACLLLAPALGASGAALGTLGAWPHVLDGRIPSLAFYRALMGTDRPGENLGLLLAWSGRWLLAFAPGAALAFLLRRRGILAAATAGLASFAALLALHLRGIDWAQAARPLPLLALAVLLVAAARARKEPRAILPACFAAYALVLLAKMVLHARVSMYGFALAMPAAMLLVAALLGWIPARLRERGAVFRGASLGVLAVVVYAHLSIQRGFLERRTVVVGAGADAFRADRRGEFVNAALAGLAKGLPPEATLLVLPEGVMINFLARRRTPARYINTMPPEVLMFGEEAMLADLRARPPGAVVLVHKPTHEYGLPWFGVDYGRALMAWVREAYQPVALYGGLPLQPGTGFGIQVLLPRRR